MEIVAGQAEVEKCLKRTAESLTIANMFLDKFKATRDPDHVAEWTKRRRL